MNKEELEKLKLSELKELAKENDLKISGLKKEEIVALFTEKYAAEEKEKQTVKEEYKEDREVRIIGKKEAPETRDASLPVEGIVTVMEDGYGFIRGKNFETGDDNVFVSPTFVKKFRLRTGDHIIGKKREAKDNERYGALIYIDKINYLDTEMIRSRVSFEDLTPVFPDERIILERPGESLSMRVMDLITPIGKGQRGLIVSPPKAGKTTILKDIALSILRNDP